MTDPDRARFVEWFIMEYGRLSPDGLIFMADTPEHVADQIERAVRANERARGIPTAYIKTDWRAAMQEDEE